MTALENRDSAIEDRNRHSNALIELIGKISARSKATALFADTLGSIIKQQQSLDVASDKRRPFDSRRSRARL
jgi:hypothetical protein